MNLIRSEFFFFTSKGYLQIAGGILFLFKFMKKGNLSSIKPSQLRNLSRVTTFSDTIYFSSIFSRFPPFLPSFLLSFDYIFNFIETNPLYLYFPAATRLQRFSKISLRNNISRNLCTFRVPSSE